MMARMVALAFCAGAVLVGSPAMAATCTRQSLQAAADSYLAAQRAGDPRKMRLAMAVDYAENRKRGDVATGLLATPLKIDFSRHLLDTGSCETFTEVIVTDRSHPYLIGTRLAARGGRIAAIESLVSDKDDWLFSASNALKWSSKEDWGPQMRAVRPTRATVIAAADAYLDLFNDKSVAVPWGTPCARLEGGAYTGKGLPTDTCNIGVPSGVKLVDRRYIYDAEAGAVAVLLNFGTGERSLPDSHTFRIEGGKIRYIHTITVCPTENCTWPTPRQVQPPPPDPED